MKCAICRGAALRPGKATVTLTRGATLVVIKDTPASICSDCGEYYLTEEVTARVMTQAENAVARQAEVEIVRYAA